jgi:plastocyanin
LTRWTISSVFHSTELTGVALFVLSTGLPPFDDVAEVDLTLHMLQHVLIIISGVLIAYPHLGRKMLRDGGRGLLPGLALAASAVVIVFWHLPGPWDSAVLNPALHLIEHFSFLLVGLVAGSWLLLLSDSKKIGALLAAFFGHMAYAVILISPWNVQVYSQYPLANQVTLGWALLLTGPTLVVGVAYVIARNPDWLGGYSGPGVRTGIKRKTFLNGVKVPGWVAPAISIVLVVALAVYFGATAYALQTARPTPAGTTIVYIAESPISWQYSPQSVRVVLGVNSTVTWVSRSIAYDTVTDRGGAFNSGTIAPGGTFSFTFTAPGEYEYYCEYHPWMAGTVVVQATG